MRRLLLSVLFPCLCAAAQERTLAFLQVGDLLAPQGPGEPYLVPGAAPGARWIDGEEAWVVSDGEWLLPRRHERPGFFDASRLASLVAGLTGREPQEFWVLPGDDTMAVPGGIVAVVQATLEELRQRLPPTVRFRIELRRLSADGPELLLHREVACVSGRTRIVSAVLESTALTDFEVEIAQGATIANPVVRPDASGAMVVLRPWVSPAGDAALTEVLVRVVEPREAEPIDCGHPGFGALDRLARRVAETAGIVRCQLGIAAIEHRWDGADGTGYVLRLMPQWHPPAPVRPGGHELEYAVDFVRLWGFRSLARMPEDLDDPGEQRGLAAVIGAMGLAVVPAADDEGPVVALDQAAVTLRAAAEARFVAAGRGPTVELALFDVPQGGGRDAADARRLGGATLTLVDGSWSCFTAYDETAVLQDWDVEVAQSARIPDPRLHRVQGGLFANLRWHRDGLEIEGELAMRQDDVVQEVPLDVAIDAPEAVNVRGGGGHVSGDRVPAVHLQKDVVRIEKPRVARVPFAARLPVRSDAPATARQGAAVLGSGRELLLVVRRAD